MIVKLYLDLTKKYKKEYGEKTILLMQVGSFYEVYGLKDNNTELILGSDIERFAEINNFNISEKNANPMNYENYKNLMTVMAGFGLPQLDKYLDKLQQNGYTIVVYNQDTNASNTTRSLFGIFSPGTLFSNDPNDLSNNIMVVWINLTKKIRNNNEKLTIGIATIDILTGKSNIYEYQKEKLS